MYARVSRYEVPVDNLAEDIRGAADTEKRVSDLPGSLGLYYLVDRESGRTMSITLWENEQAMLDSEAASTQIRQDTSSSVQAKIVGIERYEVVTQPSKVVVGTR